MVNGEHICATAGATSDSRGSVHGLRYANWNCVGSWHLRSEQVAALAPRGSVLGTLLHSVIFVFILEATVLQGVLFVYQVASTTYTTSKSCCVRGTLARGTRPGGADNEVCVCRSGNVMGPNMI